MSKIIELMPQWFYIIGSVCFIVGTLISVWRAYAIH